jgi:hypothetical protein
LAEITRELGNVKAKPGSPAAVMALTMAAATHAGDREPNLDQYWYADAVALLVRAAANEDAARSARAAPKTQRCRARTGGALITLLSCPEHLRM